MAAGLAATGLMVLMELATRARWGLAGLIDWQINQATVARITGRSAEAAVVPGLGFHALHGLVAGLVFVLILPVLPTAVPIEASGLGYGVVLFALTLVVQRPVTRGYEGLGAHGSAAVAVALLTHLAYGLLLAFLLIWP